MEYVRSLMKTVFSRKNAGFIVFMLINIFPVCLVYGQRPLLYAFMSFLIIFVLYFLFVMLAGEFIARFMLGATTRITLDERTILSVSFSNAYTIAKNRNPIISDHIKLYVFEGTTIDAYAFGRHTLCLSSAAIQLCEQDLTTLLLMKFAQFSHHDSEILAVLTAGNIWYVTMAIICKWYIYILGFIVWLFLVVTGHGSGGFVLGRGFQIMADITEKIILIFVKMVLLIGVESYKNNVYTNDIFVCDCGFKNALIRFLQDFEPEQIGHETLFGAINSMKPDRHLRLEKVRNYDSQSNSMNGFRIVRR